MEKTPLSAIHQKDLDKNGASPEVKMGLPIVMRKNGEGLGSKS